MSIRCGTGRTQERTVSIWWGAGRTGERTGRTGARTMSIRCGHRPDTGSSYFVSLRWKMRISRVVLAWMSTRGQIGESHMKSFTNV